MATNAEIDENGAKSLIAVSNVDEKTIVPIYADPVTHALLVSV